MLIAKKSARRKRQSKKVQTGKSEGESYKVDLVRKRKSMHKTTETGDCYTVLKRQEMPCSDLQWHS